MIAFDFSAEYAALVMIVAILLSFAKDFDAKNIEFSYIKVMYVVTLISVLCTIVAMVSAVPGSSSFNASVAWVANVFYFVTIPMPSMCYVMYVRLITVVKFDQHQRMRKMLPALIPYGIYLVVVLIGVVYGKLFSISVVDGYVRGDWYRLPYIIAAYNLLAAAVTLSRYLRILHTEIKHTMVATTILAGVCMAMQFHFLNTAMTGITHTACILSIHLYSLNIKKTTDRLTGVYNRMSLVHSLEEHVEKNQSFSLYVFSLRGMKTINERYGMECGDKVLMRTAQIFIGHTTDKTVFRYGGDEFGLLLDEKTENHDQVVERIVTDLETAQAIDGNTVQVDFVYTRVDYDLFGKNARELISAVDYSLSSLKEGPGKRYLYDTAVVKELIWRSKMVEQIKNALEQQMFEVHYQPIYSQETGTFVQMEALVRMRDGEGYLVYPGDFIALAVKTGLIVQMTYLILERVCADLRYLFDHYGEGLTIRSASVNFPYLQFADVNMEATVMEILNRHNIEPTMIKIEITEREMVADTAYTGAIMSRMAEKGFGFELDDFGMDYSNMSVVMGLPLETVKLDRSFLLSAFEGEGKCHFFQHLVQAIAGLDATIICEGVENQKQLDFALANGCQYIQGYFFAKPMERGALCDFLKAHQTNKKGELTT